MSETKCCYNLKCKRNSEYWLTTMEKSIYYEIPYRSPWWYHLCLKHLKKAIKNTKIEIIGLKTERVRKFEHKIFCSRKFQQVEFRRWKMFIDWEEIASELDMDKPLTFEVYRALEKHYHNNYLKIKNRIEKKRL